MLITRLIEPSDLPTILSIESQCFEFPWPEDELRRVLSLPNCFGIAAVVDGLIAGYIIYETHSDRIHIVSIAVHQSERRQGIGSILVEELVEQLSTHRSRILVDVRETNLAAQLFFRSLGFKAVCVIGDFYEETEEDAYVMQYRATQEASR